MTVIDYYYDLKDLIYCIFLKTEIMLFLEMVF